MNDTWLWVPEPAWDPEEHHTWTFCHSHNVWYLNGLDFCQECFDSINKGGFVGGMGHWKGQVGANWDRGLVQQSRLPDTVPAPVTGLATVRCTNSIAYANASGVTTLKPCNGTLRFIDFVYDPYMEKLRCLKCDAVAYREPIARPEARPIA